MTNEQSDQVLVLGSELNMRELNSFSWGNIPDSVNITDYDVVVLDLVPLEDEDFADSLTTDQAPSRQQFVRHIWGTDSLTYLIGRPDSRIGNPSVGCLPVQRLLPYCFDIRYEKGIAVREVKEDLTPYFDVVTEWSWYTHALGTSERGQLDATSYALSLPVAEITAETEPLAVNNRGEALGFAAQFHAKTLSIRDEVVEAARSGLVLWLPAPTSVPHDEGVRLLLEGRHGVSPKSSRPSWIDQYRLPNHETALHNIERIEREIASLEDTKSEGDRFRLEQEQWQGLLYEQGTVLEELVRAALRELGAEVTEPGRGGNDGELIDPSGRHAVLEIKGRKGHIGRNDVRQLHDWVSAREEDPNWQGKGILIGNPESSHPPTERSGGFDSNAVGLSSRWGISLMTSAQLFEALRRLQKKELMQHQLWERIFQADGLAEPLNSCPGQV